MEDIRFKRLKRFFRNSTLSFLFLLGCLSGFSQAKNNRIQDRVELKINQEPIRSTTANSTVEWNCINKSLTKKCLVYHNDQWFHFTPPNDGKYYINLSAQHCRDNQGVQMIVIEGNPCEVTSYKILECIPKIFQDDMFIELDSLKANTLYLVNVDGFLGDSCEFGIQFSSTPAGMPQKSISRDSLQLKVEAKTKSVLLTWHANQSLLETINHFEIYRLKAGDVKSTFVSLIPVRGNALGALIENYSHTDTLKQAGNYEYRIIGVENDEGRKLLDKVNVWFKPEQAVKKIVAMVPFSFSGKGRVEVFVINKSDNELLDYSVKEFVQPETLSIDLTKFAEYGILNFWIKLRHIRNKELKQYVFRVSSTGELESIDN